MKEPVIGDLEADYDAPHPGPAPQVSQPPHGVHAPSDGHQPAPERRGSGDGVTPFFLASLFGAVAALWGAWLFLDQTPATPDRLPPFVVVDSDTLLQAKLQEGLLAGELNEERLAEQFRSRLDEAFRRYTERGIAILHKNALIAVPDNRDVTLVIADALDISEETIASVYEFQRTGELPREVVERVTARAKGASPPSDPPPEVPEVPEVP